MGTINQKMVVMKGIYFAHSCVCHCGLLLFFRKTTLQTVFCCTRECLKTENKQKDADAARLQEMSFMDNEEWKVKFDAYLAKICKCNPDEAEKLSDAVSHARQMIVERMDEDEPHMVFLGSPSCLSLSIKQPPSHPFKKNSLFSASQFVCALW